MRTRPVVRLPLDHRSPPSRPPFAPVRNRPAGGGLAGENLRSIGATVLEVPPRNRSPNPRVLMAATWRLARRHCAGSAGSTQDLVHVPEFKTHSAKSFNDLVASAAPNRETFAQMQTYMHLTGLTGRCILRCARTPTSLHVERIEHDAAYAQGCWTKPSG